MMQYPWEQSLFLRDELPAGSSFWVFKTNRYFGDERFESIQLPAGITLRVITKGRGRVTMSGRTDSVGVGELFCAVPGITIDFRDEDGHPWHWYELQLKGPGAMDVVHACGCSESRAVTKPSDPERVIAGFKKMHEHFLGQLRQPHTIIAIMHEIVAACNLEEASPENASTSAKLVDQALTLIDSFAAVHLNVSELSKRLHVDRTTLQRAFKKELSVSPVQYLKDLKIQRAKDYLLSTTLPLSTIASSVGYANEKYFIRCFREAVGIPPGAWRAQSRQK